MFVCKRPIFELASPEFEHAGFTLAERKTRDPTHNHCYILQLVGIRTKPRSIFVDGKSRIWIKFYTKILDILRLKQDDFFVFVYTYIHITYKAGPIANSFYGAIFTLITISNNAVIYLHYLLKKQVTYGT